MPNCRIFSNSATDFSKMCPRTSTLTSSRKSNVLTVWKKLRPIVFELQVVDFRVAREKTTVVSVVEPRQAAVPFVDGLEQVDEVPPARVGHLGKRRQRAVGQVDAAGRQQLAVFAKGDEDDTVENSLGDEDRRIERLLVLVVQMLDQPNAVIVVFLVQFIADGPLPLFGPRGASASGARSQCARRTSPPAPADSRIAGTS